MFIATGDPRTVAGVMSGTSADGIDVAICRVLPPPAGGQSGSNWGELIGFHATPYSAEVRRHIHEVRALGACTLAELCQLTRRITLEHAGAVRMALETVGVKASDLDAVADHGQTLYHLPPVTLQVLDPALLAYTVGAPVVSDFRRADCAAGGQGAPLVPYADLRLFSDPLKTRALLNLGGIANVTLLPAGGPGGRLVAFDTGPANCLSDHLCRAAVTAGGGGTDGGYDEGGRLALRGTPHEPVIAAFLRSDYFRQPPPKSTDGPAMVAAFEKAGGLRLSRDDALATAAECVARSVADALLQLDPAPDEVIASGGGLHNAAVTRALTRLLHDIPLRSTDELGIPAHAKEAIAFALLGDATLNGTPANLPSCTGASRPVVLGCVTPKP